MTTTQAAEALLSLGGDLSRPLPVSATHLAWSLNPSAHVAAPTEHLFVMRQGDTLIDTLTDAGLTTAQATEAATALRGVLPQRDLQPGLEIAITTDLQQEDAPLRQVRVELSPETTVLLQRDADGALQASRVVRPVIRSLARIDGTVISSLQDSLALAGVPSRQIATLMNVLGHVTDLQDDVRPGDTFQLIAERMRSQDGDMLQQGNVLQAHFTLSGQSIVLWRYTDARGAVEWRDDQGRSVRNTSTSNLLRTPLDGVLITTSGFGRRNHPVLRYSRAHRGIDFSAPTGTPVYAAADGVVTFVGRKGGYGNTIEIRHGPQTETLYAHLSRINPAVQAGQNVRQGQVIGNVGSTGLSTGPHLHYEVHVNNQPVDPRQQHSITRVPPLSQAELERFRRYRTDMLRVIGTFQGPGEVAAAQ